MSPIPPVAIEPESFPWYDYRGYTFSLGLQVGPDDALNSGHSGSAFDPAKGKPDVRGGMGEQAETAYAKQEAILAAAGLAMADVTRVVENVTIAGLPAYAEAREVRERLFPHGPAVQTVVVDRLVRGKALIEVEVHATRGGGQALVLGSDGSWRRETVRQGHDGAVYLPTLLPIGPDGEIVAEGDVIGQYFYCLERAGELLQRAGLDLSHLVQTIDYSTPATRERYPKTGRPRRDLLGPVYPGAAGILMSELHAPGVLLALDAVASVHTPEPVNPGWSRYDSLTYTPGVRAGDTLYMSGFAALDMESQQATHVGDLRGQAEATYDAIGETLAAVGAGFEHLLTTVEYVTPAGLPDYRAVADVRKAKLRDEFLLEVVPTAWIPA